MLGVVIRVCPMLVAVRCWKNVDALKVLLLLPDAAAAAAGCSPAMVTFTSVPSTCDKKHMRYWFSGLGCKQSPEG